jgi:hypothetical protein
MRSHSLLLPRLWQTPLAALCIAGPIFMMIAIGREEGFSMVSPLGIYIGFCLIASALLTLIARKLYSMHGLRRIVFDIPVWFMVSALIALPLGTASLFSHWAGTVDARFDAEDLQRGKLIIAFVLYFQLMPVFFATEFIVSTAAALKQRTVD